MLVRFTLWAALFVLTCGCSAESVFLRRHVIVGDKQGRSLGYEDGRFIAEDEESLVEHVRAIAESSRDSQRILLFIHGGLNGLETSIRRTELIEHIMSENTPEPFYPIFVNWDSGLVESYWDHLLFVRQGKNEPLYGPLTAPFVFIEDIGRVVARAPLTWFRQAENDWKALAIPSQRWTTECPDGYGRIFHREIEAQNALYCILSGNDSSTFLDSNGQGCALQSVSVYLGEADVRWLTWSATARTASYYATLPLKYLFVPFVDGLGKPSWDNMRRRAKNLFRRPDEFDLRDAMAATDGTAAEVEPLAREASQSPEKGVVAVFLRELDRVLRDDPNGCESVPTKRRKVTIVAHSMGTFVANDILRRWGNLRSLDVENIVYMAAACSINDFLDAVVPFMESPRGKDTRFYNLTLHPWNDARETNWDLLDLVPRGSLLEWIDNFLTSPDVHADRTLGKWENIIQATHLLPKSVRDRITIKAFGVGPASLAGPQEHGGFDDYAPEEGQEWRFWSESFWKAPAPERAAFSSSAP